MNIRPPCCVMPINFGPRPYRWFCCESVARGRPASVTSRTSIGNPCGSSPPSPPTAQSLTSRSGCGSNRDAPTHTTNPGTPRHLFLSPRAWPVISFCGTVPSGEPCKPVKSTHTGSSKYSRGSRCRDKSLH
jgi:hypothetical protein